ncbi:MAG TPA: PEGA domain-containing protein [Patescibacteria group bacterium]|nr:PEGA domain-containing protein [Patescibacteria group bacterium]
MRKQLFVPLFILSVLIFTTIIVVLYGKGYRLNFEKGKPDFSGTGLLVATSIPDGAQVFINDHLTTATDNTINLAPKSYKIRIVKEGYFPWEKTLVIKSEVVAKADALLFPSAPKLESITNTGIENPVMDPSQTKLAFTVATQSATKKRGVYVLDMTARPILTLQGASTQIADDSIALLSRSKLAWSPDGSEIIATVSGQSTYLLDAKGFNKNPKDVTETMTTVNATFAKQQEEKLNAQKDTLSSRLKLLVNDFNIFSWSVDETKFLYTSNKDIELPTIINPRLIGANSTPEDRSIKEGSVYVYDIKEDRNYKIIDSLPENNRILTWFPDSKHLIYVHDQKVNIMEYDSLNQTTIFAGPFLDTYVFPWPDGSKIVILTNLGNKNITPNLYTIGLK